MDLLQRYDSIKDQANNTQTSDLMNVGSVRGMQHPGALKWRAAATQETEKLKEECSKRVILDIYCKIIPLDSDFIQGNKGMMKQDVDKFLGQKDMSAQQYLMSCGEKTNAPLVEFVNRSINNIGKAFMEEADKTLKNAQEKNVDIPPPSVDPDSEETEEQLIEIQKDDEYESFISKLKQKTVDKIVKDVSGLIQGKKEEQNMSFDTTNESAIETCLDYFHTKVWKENTELTEDQNETVIGLAIRESTLNIIDKVFNQPEGEFKTFSSNIRFGKGVLMNESVIEDVLVNFT